MRSHREIIVRTSSCTTAWRPHTNQMGDTFAEGLYDYVTSGAQNIQPQEGEQCITYDQMNAIFTVRMFWFELATWIRNYMLSRYSGVGDADAAYARLKQTPDAYIAMLQQIFGDGVITEEYIQSFDNYIELIRAFIDAQMEGNIDEINKITQQLYQNVTERGRIHCFNQSLRERGRSEEPVL